MRNDWVAGEPKSVVTAPVLAGVPECESIKIIGNLIEGSELEVEVVYSGGVEGESYYQWLRKGDATEEYFPIEGEITTRYVPTLEDVGKCLAVEYTPVNKEGEEGETCRCVLEKPIEPSAPEIQNLKIMGVLAEQHVLTLDYEYTGGHFGPHMIQWFRCDRSKRLTKIGRPNSATLALGKREVDCTIEVVVTPVRIDGVRGRMVKARSDGVVSAGVPQTNFLNVVGEPLPGNTLELEVEYFGGEPGEPIIEWAREDLETGDFVVVESGVRCYTIKEVDQGKLIRVTYTPVRQDGTPGETKSRMVQVPRGDAEEEAGWENEEARDLDSTLPTEQQMTMRRHVDPNDSTHFLEETNDEVAAAVVDAVDGEKEEEKEEENEEGNMDEVKDTERNQ